MKSLAAISTGTLCLAVLACSTAAEPPPSATGGTSSGGSGQAGTTTMSGGGSGNTSSGGTSTSSGGTVAGGSSGSSNAGSSGSGATQGGSGGQSGATSSGGSAGSGAVDTTLVGAWDGALLEYACGSQGTTNYDCPQPSSDNCKNATAADGASVIPPSNNVPSSWTMGGNPGTMYNVTMHVQGVVEVSWYHGGTRAAGDSSVTVTPRNLFQVGGTALTFADTGNGFDYNQYELDVTPPGGGAPSVYFLNSVIPSENPHTSSTTQHLTFDVDYMATIQVPGGGKVSVTVRDSNCVEVQNCGTSSQSSCMGPRSISLAGDMPPPPSSWNGKVTSSGVGGAVENGQFIHFDITSVTVAQ